LTQRHPTDRHTSSRYSSHRALTKHTVYSGVTVTLLAYSNHLPGIIAISYSTICALALASHAKTTFTDPGSIPQAAVPRTMDTRPSKRAMHAMCSHCQTYKPPLAHHCRICNRCISRMDHHCPWMNNCVGIGNLSKCIVRMYLQSADVV
jgi:DHHC palmitoyltransferase